MQEIQNYLILFILVILVIHIFRSNPQENFQIKSSIHNHATIATKTTKPSPTIPTTQASTYKYSRKSESCQSMLSNGNWSNFKYLTSKQVPDVKKKWNYSGSFDPFKCELHNYTASEIQKCLSLDPDKPLIQLMGDSRTRVLYRSLAALRDGRNKIHAEQIHHDLKLGNFTFIWSQSMLNSSIKFGDFYPKVIRGFDEFYSFYDQAQLVIIGEQVLHPLVQFIQQAEKNEKYSKKEIIRISKQYFTTEINWFAENQLPKLAQNNHRTVIVMSSEMYYKDYLLKNKETWGFKETREIQRFYNAMMKERVAEYDNVFHMATNNMTTHSPADKHLLPDGSHKITPWSPQTIPDALMADLQRIYNLHCNSKLFRTEEKLCCIT